MAGGKGRRLLPYTAILPKPLMPIGDIPILEVMFKQLKYYGVTRVTLAVGYLAELIQAYFNTGSKIGLEISYSKEEKNLGTIGPITLINELDDDFLVMNGDILTDLNFRDLFRAHKKNSSLITIASYKKKIDIDLGVLEVNDKLQLEKYIEKPVVNYDVSMGIYAMKKEITEYLPVNDYFDIPNLMWKLIEEGKPPYIYPFDGRWLDIGRKEDYDRAIQEFQKYESDFLPG